MDKDMRLNRAAITIFVMGFVAFCKKLLISSSDHCLVVEGVLNTAAAPGRVRSADTAYSPVNGVISVMLTYADSRHARYPLEGAYKTNFWQ